MNVTGQLNELPDDSDALRPFLSRLRHLVQAELDPVHTPQFSDGFLLRFLRARDFEVELALKLFLNYQQWRRVSPEISSCLSPSSVLGLLNNCYHAVLPERDHSGSRVLVYRIGQWVPKDWSAFQVFRVSLMTSELISMEIETQRRGLKAIFDLKGWSFGHAMQINPSLARKISSVLTDSFPLKVRGIHLINEPMFFRPVFAMIRPFLPDKIKQRIHMHGADFCETLTDFFTPSLLPPEYGGEGPSVEEVCQEWTNQLLRSEALLEQIATHPTGDIAVDPGNSVPTETETTPTETETTPTEAETTPTETETTPPVVQLSEG
ncbi:alpha-tocopherol transfer protein [Lampris incognitus]|uniref:alpha-tocopherol transfer protein n=1 Tax=Lampris incognitus TaxID=2546036 RepID=UPI0024B56449|nr:alpha-tocopherol transfer protein [Lampris incognitus]